MDFLIQGIFMAQVINEMDVPSHSFVFHGTGERYFLICVVNVLLTIITLGIYLPWALMKCKRYLYANMEVNGQRFSYGITGGNVFFSCLVFVFFYFAILMTVSADMPLVVRGYFFPFDQHPRARWPKLEDWSPAQAS